MRSLADRAAPLGLGLVLLLAVACTTDLPSPPAPTHPLGPSPSTSPAASATAPPSRAGIPLPTPGTPWDGPALLEAMRDSTRPGGVPEEVQSSRLADAIAETVWTVDGRAWDTVAISGFCGTSTCTIDLAGGHVGRAGEDLWTLEVDPGSATVEPVVAEVRSLRWELVDALDRLARSLDDEGSLGTMMLTTARWLPPPAEPGRFMLSYRSGGEEGACSRELLLDAAHGAVVERSAAGC